MLQMWPVQPPATLLPALERARAGRKISSLPLLQYKNRNTIKARICESVHIFFNHSVNSFVRLSFRSFIDYYFVMQPLLNVSCHVHTLRAEFEARIYAPFFIQRISTDLSCSILARKAVVHPLYLTTLTPDKIS